MPYTKTNGIADFFTPDRRQKIQMFAASIAPIVIMAGLATQAQTEQWLIIVGAALQFGASLLSLINLRGVASIWSVLRGAIYTAGAVIAPALTVLGFIDSATQATVLTGLSLGLSSLSSLVAIFWGKTQELAAAKSEG